MDDDMIVCRCEEVTVRDIKTAIAEGATDLTGIKRRTRSGMGHCQGRTCESLIARILAQETGKKAAEILAGSARPPVTPVTFGVLAGELSDHVGGESSRGSGAQLADKAGVRNE